MSTAAQAQVKAPPAIKPVSLPAQSGLLQRKCACGGMPGVDGECAECRAKRLSVQRRAATPASSQGVPPIVYEVLGTPGKPLDAGTRAFMEPRFGHDFSNVRVHTDAKAAESARAVSALAYTVGRNVVFGTGQYAPGTNEGQRLVAHELTHVVQQGLGKSISDGATSPGYFHKHQTGRRAYVNNYGMGQFVARGLEVAFRQHEAGTKPFPASEEVSLEDTRPRILRVEGDTVIVVNAQNQPEKVSLSIFGSPQWAPGNPGNPAVLRANDAYRKARMQILTKAGQRPIVTFEKCDDEQKRVLSPAFRLAASSVNVALEKLRLAQGGAPSALLQVERHFKTRDAQDIKIIIDNFSRVKSLLDDITGFDCSNTEDCKKKSVVAWSIGYAISGVVVHPCKLFFDLKDLRERVLTVIHESCHLAFGATFGFLGKEAYETESLKLPREKAMKNAENYSNFAVGKYNP